MWNITKVVKKGKYLYGVCKEHPKATKYGYVLLHRLVAENTLSRRLTDDEVVHHKNHDTHDNRPENLEVMDKYEHSRLHGAERVRKTLSLVCPWCKCKFERFENQTSKRKNIFCSRSCNAKNTRSLGKWQRKKSIVDDINEA